MPPAPTRTNQRDSRRVAAGKGWFRDLIGSWVPCNNGTVGLISSAAWSRPFRYGANVHVRADLLDGQQQAWDALTRPGTWWTGPQRAELAVTALAAMTARESLLPWIAPSTVAVFLADDLLAPAVAHDAIYRVAAHAATLT